MVVNLKKNTYPVLVYIFIFILIPPYFGPFVESGDGLLLVGPAGIMGLAVHVTVQLNIAQVAGKQPTLRHDLLRGKQDYAVEYRYSDRTYHM
jgi:hypothetical protein